MGKTSVAWVYWIVISLSVGGYFGYRMLSEDQTIFLPGKTSHGHYQIELACGACHKDSFGGGEVLQQACMECHGNELKNVNDSHPRSKFLNPRNADRIKNLDARVCITCHVEHKPEITTKMGVTVPDDVCFNCHQDIAEDRASHVDMKFNTCASAGCHNFHDNQGLYEDFLLKHSDEADVFDVANVPQRNLRESIDLNSNYPLDQFPLSPLTLSEIDVPSGIKSDPKILQDWSTAVHATSGVNCSACHLEKVKTGLDAEWTNKPDYKVCLSCHERESEGFLNGKHGMRLKQNLSPMTPGQANLPMQPGSNEKELNCISCHSAHKFDTAHASVDACLSCHNDEHSNAYKGSIHFTLWFNEKMSGSKNTTGVSCATCHMPRSVHKSAEGRWIFVQHNQNDNLRPNEKMLRSVCMNCHGLGFAIDALADSNLVKNNFKGRPQQHIKSIDMAKNRVKSKGRSKTKGDYL